MHRIFAVLAVSAGLLVPAISWAENGRDTLFGSQLANLDLTSKRHLPSLGLTPQPKKKNKSINVSFTRSWVDSQPKPKGSDEWRCLSEALYFEARGETVKGQFAVAEVIMNRVKSARFPGSICGVINQGTGRKYQCQFTYTCDGYKEVISEPKAFERVSKIARAVIDGVPAKLTDGATHYHTTAVRPKWSRVYTKTARIGVHVFYRHNYRTASAD